MAHQCSTMIVPTRVPLQVRLGPHPTPLGSARWRVPCTPPSWRSSPSSAKAENQEGKRSEQLPGRRIRSSAVAVSTSASSPLPTPHATRRAGWGWTSRFRPARGPLGIRVPGEEGVDPGRQLSVRPGTASGPTGPHSAIRPAALPEDPYRRAQTDYAVRLMGMTKVCAAHHWFRGCRRGIIPHASRRKRRVPL